MLELLVCVAFCVSKADPVPDAASYDLLVNGTVVANFFEPVVDFREHPDLWRDEPFTTAWVAVNSAGRSVNPSNEVWFNRACLEHQSAADQQGCETACCVGCVLELEERYDVCP